MKLVLQRYAELRNAERNASGKLFEQRYESEPVTSLRQLAAVQMYIEANPIRAAISESALEFEWSSYAIYAGAASRSRIPADMLTPTSWYESLGATRAERSEAYRREFADYLSRGEKPRHSDRITTLEEASQPYTLRLRRPNGTSAREPAPALSLSSKTRCVPRGYSTGE